MTTGDTKRKNQFRLTQFRNALKSLRSYSGEIRSGREAQRLPGIGKGIGTRIDEILQTGTLSDLAKPIILSESDRIMNELCSITGIGESHARSFMTMGIKSIDDLSLSGVHLTHHMKIGLKYAEAFKQRIPYSEITQLRQQIATSLSSFDIVWEVCGSYRRQATTSGDIDILVTGSQCSQCERGVLQKIVDKLHADNILIDDLTTRGESKYMGVCGGGRRIDIRYLPPESYIYGLLYFTGSMETNRIMRSIAISRGLLLNEYGLYRDGVAITGLTSERDVFEYLGMEYLEPSAR